MPRLAAAIVTLVVLAVALALWLREEDEPVARTGGDRTGTATANRDADATADPIVARQPAADPRTGTESPPAGDAHRRDPPAAPQPLLLAGRVVTPDGAGVTDARITIAEINPIDDSGFGARVYSTTERKDLATTSDADGRFEVRGTAKRELVVAPRKDGYALRKEVRAEPGSLRLVVVLERAGTIVATLAAGSEELGRLVHGEVRRPNSDNDIRGSVGVFRDRALTRSGLAPGKYDFVLIGRTNRKPVFTAHGVTVRGGETCDDPRLSDIDLTALAKPIEVVVLDPLGIPVGGATVWAYEGASGRGQRADESGRIRFVAGGNGVDIEIREDGYRRVRRDGVTADLTIRLQPLLRVEVFCAGVDPELAKPGRIHMFLSPANYDIKDPRSHAEQKQVRLPADGGRSVFIDLDHAGAYDIKWAIAVDHGRGSSFVHPDPSEAQVVAVRDHDGPQRVEITIDETLLRETAKKAAALDGFDRDKELPPGEFERQLIEKLREANRHK